MYDHKITHTIPAYPQNYKLTIYGKNALKVIIKKNNEASKLAQTILNNETLTNVCFKDYIIKLANLATTDIDYSLLETQLLLATN